MNRMLFVLILISSKAAIGGETPIPQDPARSEKTQKEMYEWFIGGTQGYYDKIGKKDARWDGEVRKALDLAARSSIGQFDPPITMEQINQAVKVAIDAGCDDPYVNYLYARTQVGKNYPGPEESLSRTKAAARIFVASQYPAYRRAGALEVIASMALDPKVVNEARRKEAESDLEGALALLPESVKTDEHNASWEDRWVENLADIVADYRKLGVDPVVAYERVDSKLSTLPEIEALRLILRGKFWLNYGWEARGKGFAPQVPGAAMATFEQRLEAARKGLEQAWKLQPDRAGVAASLMDIDKAIGDGDRTKMELWFDRAMKANPDCYLACNTKLDWLDPKWRGTPEEMLAFGRACRDTKNWRAGITLLVGDAHHRIMGMLPPAERQKYATGPEFWADIKPVFDEYLSHYKTDYITRSKYAVFAFYAGRMPEAHAQFQILGENLVQWPNSPYVPLESMKRMRAQAALRAGTAPQTE